ncbi:vitamin K epoxide reductase family protein [Microbacterium rhizosphaerae]|uniref:Vitamin K epoxide reductase family protein n=1 Tax=Microbacterium rhizosphaerae TaxID=1678237 RepID=A0ABZ0SSQ0_9MICO|nr:vitamin K epoxide reductase family protein [Microbacterium rhizosphaerae]WPR91279.1 vitamin K epoxide reductase family protein [Microbacterium rhizosphaerae]
MAQTTETTVASDTSSPARPTVLAVWLIVAGVIGWWAAFQLTLEKFHLLENPGSKASCDISILVQCGKNLGSWQGSAFGFPNPIIGLTAWMAPVVVGVAILAGARFAAWFWVLFWLGFVFAFGFVCWLITQSIFVLLTLCPWCMVTWAVTIPSFYAVTLHLFRTGVFPVPERGREIADRLMAWVPLMAIVSYFIILLIAQARLNAIVNIWQTMFH